MVFTSYAIFITLFWILISTYLLVNCRKITYLKKVRSHSSLPKPDVAIIIAVRNEEVEVEEALSSICRLDYPNKRIVVINDRSTDRTPEILNRMAQANLAINVIHISELPKGWLGKNHALFQGYQATSEEWMLFTDADVLFEEKTLKKAMNYALMHQLDHLTSLVEITSRSWLFKSVMNTFALMLDIRQKPWDISNPSSSASLGVGAFNLVKRTAYEKAGTHSVISLRPDDDLKLGERIKAAGLRQDVVYGDKELSLEWYTSLSEFIKGLMKNTFSVSNYHFPTALAMALTTFFIFVLPVPLLLCAGSTWKWMALAILLAQLALMLFKRGIRGKWWDALFIPFAGMVMIYIVLKSAIKTISQGGIYWRESFYPLSELKKQK